ncbi:hypothetical protein ACV33T_30345, partial [Pseudomonas aeruginosa]
AERHRAGVEGDQVADRGEGHAEFGGPLLTTALLRVPRKNALLGLIALFVVGQVIGALAPGYAVMVAA